MSKFSIPVYGQVITDSQVLIQKIKVLIAGNKLPLHLLNALKDLLETDDLNNLFGAKDKEKLQLIFAKEH